MTDFQTPNVILASLSPFPFDPETWIESLVVEAEAVQARFLLAHTTSGIIWGGFQEGQLYTSTYGLALDLNTVQEIRLFGPIAETYLWRDAAGHWQGRRLEDDGADELLEEIGYDELYLLWGNRVEWEADGFTRVRDARQHITQIIPLSGLTPSFNLWLKMRHYFAYDTLTQQARIAYSRLVDLMNEDTDS